MERVASTVVRTLPPMKSEALVGLCFEPSPPPQKKVSLRGEAGADKRRGGGVGSLFMHERQLGKLEQASCETTDGVDLTTLRPMHAGVKTNIRIQQTTSVELEQHGRQRWNCSTGTAKMSNSCPRHVCCLFRTVRFRLCLLCRLMVRKGWTQMEVPSGWVQILRGPRPKSEQWPKQSKSISKVKGRGQQRQSSVSPRHDPDSVMSNARSRIAKLEAAMVAVGESDPTYPSLFDEQSASRRGGRVQENELSALRSGQVGVPQTETRFERGRCNTITPRGGGSPGVRGERDQETHSWGVFRHVGVDKQISHGGLIQTRNSRYGLRGVRIGEASHPGPPEVQRRIGVVNSATS